MNVIINGKTVYLDRSDVIGSGGEGTVFKTKIKNEEIAVKIYDETNFHKEEKLRNLTNGIFNLNQQVLQPKELVFDRKGTIVGFTMPLLPYDAEEIRSLANRKYRTDFGINNKIISEIFLDANIILTGIHKQGFVIGDLNGLNVFFSLRKTYWIDVDSWQYANFPCPVATEEYLDPMLYSKDLGKGIYFKPENDWYSYAVSLFKSMLLVHPYGGTHKSVKSLTARAKNKITVFDSGVIYPKIAISPDILDDSLSQIFYNYFKRGERVGFPEKVLNNYLKNLTECPTCKTWYPDSRKFCPVCSAKTLIIIGKPVPKISVKGVTAEEFLATKGPILLVKIQKDMLKVLARENGHIVLYTNSGIRKELFRDTPGTRYDIFGETLIVNPSYSTNLYLVDISGESPIPLEKTTTQKYAQTRHAIFRASVSQFFRMAGSTLLAGSLTGKTLVERQIIPVVENQTWFSVDEESSKPFVFGLFHILKQQVFWIYSDKGYFEFNMSPLTPGETLIDLSVKFSDDEALVLRKTLDLGTEYLLTEVVDKRGKIVSSNKIKVQDHPHPNIHGTTFHKGICLHATDSGIVQEKVKDNTFKTFAETKSYVSGGDQLLKYKDGLLVIKEDRVIYLQLN